MKTERDRMDDADVREVRLEGPTLVVTGIVLVVALGLVAPSGGHVS